MSCPRPRRFTIRPLELSLVGFRSYRTEQTIPLAELELVAIIGNTGAGKSSLLEAITWALYGAATWSMRANGELLAHGAKRMSVALRFEASGKEWKVVRTYARSGAGGAELTCVSDPTVAKVDGVREVDKKVPAIIGLSYEVFCSCVLLPQGKFERLLKATKGDRTDLLKSILRLDQLGDIRELAAAQVTILRDRELELAHARGQFRPDPGGDLARARATIARLAPERDRLAAAQGALEQLDRALERYRTHSTQAQTAADRLSARREDWPASLGAIVVRSAELAPRGDEIAERRSAADVALRALEQRLAAASAAGADAASLVRRIARVEELGRRLKDLAAVQSVLDGHRNQVAASAQNAQARQAEVTDSEQALASLQGQLSEVEARVEQATAAVAILSAALEALAAAEVDVTSAESVLAGAQQSLAGARAAREELLAREGEARAARDAAQLACDESVRRNSAAHAAAGCAPGDPCPVCAVPLANDFVVPVVADLEATEQRLAQAEATLSAAADASGRAETDQRVAKREVERLQAAHAEALALRKRAYGAVEAAGGDVPDTGIGALRVALDAARERHDALIGERAEREEARAQAASRLAAAEAEHRAHTATLTAAERSLSDLTREVKAIVTNLPAFCAVPADETPTAPTVSALLECLADMLAEAERLGAELASAREASTRIAAEAHDLELAVEREITGPATRARDAMLALAQELPAEDRVPLGTPPLTDDLTAMLDHATALDAAVGARATALRTAAETAEDKAQRAIDTSAITLVNTGRSDRASLRADLELVRIDVGAAERDAASAEREVPGATRLDELSASAAQLRAGFEALRDILNDGAFVGYVVARRQRALLAHASRVLQEITDRYAFTDDFQMLDRESGLPRSPDTLSGGETFIASLALALGLVEVADRAGGDLRALFLDEGFGTLDVTVLDTALSALHERAKGERLIGLISHVPMVAERIDTVLEVRDTVEGSTVSLLTGEQRDQKVMEHVSAAAGIG